MAGLWAGLQPLQVCLQTRLVHGRWRSGGGGIRPACLGQSAPHRDRCDTRLVSTVLTQFWSPGWELSIPPTQLAEPPFPYGAPTLQLRTALRFIPISPSRYPASSLHQKLPSMAPRLLPVPRAQPPAWLHVAASPPKSQNLLPCITVSPCRVQPSEESLNCEDRQGIGDEEPMFPRLVSQLPHNPPGSSSLKGFLLVDARVSPTRARFVCLLELSPAPLQPVAHCSAGGTRNYQAPTRGTQFSQSSRGASQGHGTWPLLFW